MVTLSSFESESVALSEAIKQTIWWMKVLKDYQMPQKSILIHVDNRGLLDAVTGQRCVSMRLKHLDVRYKFSREAVANGPVEMAWREGSKNAADMFTKPLGRVLFHTHRKGVGVKKLEMIGKVKQEMGRKEETKKEEEEKEE